MLNDLADALEICLSHANESPTLIHKRITGFPGLDEKVRDQLLRRMVVERFKFLRSEKSTKSVELQLKDFAPFLHLPDDDPKTQKLLRRLIAIDIATSRAAIGRDEMKDIYPNHAKWIDQCLKKHKTLTYVRWLDWVAEHELRRKRRDEIVLSDEYVVEKHIGRGGLKDVYQVVQKSTGQIIAFKELNPHTFSNAAYQDALRREAMLQAKLQHQGVPSVFTLNNRDADNLVFLEHHINGKPWSELIDEMSLDENLRVLLRTANIVAFAHKECQIIHADLKPENVMIEKGYGEIYLVDWGHAIDMDSEKKDGDDEPISGTREYMPPESLSPRNQATTALDVFLLGGILYRSLTGKPPFPKYQDAASKEITLPDRTPSGERIPSELAGLVLKAMDRDPVKRFVDASEFAQALERYIRRGETLKHYAATEQRYQNALDQLSNPTNDSSFLSQHTIELIEIANEFRFDKENLQGLGDDSDPALIEASRSEKKARLSLVDTAIALGDYGMAEGQLNLAETLADPLSTGAGIPKRRQQIKDGVAKRQRDRRLPRRLAFSSCSE